ncbi:DUF1840 domain-containing protein [Achromobacter sp. AGC39]
MLITFHSKVVAEVLMLSDHAGPILQAAGKPIGDKIPERGVFTVEQLGPAIDGIERAIADAEPPLDDEDDEDKAPRAAMARTVGLKERAFPLLDMLRQSQAAGVEVTWEASRGW